MTIGVIPELIKKARKKKGYGQGDLSQKSGLSQSVISKMERGKSLTLENLCNIADALEISIDDLLGRTVSNEEIKKTNVEQLMEDISDLKDQAIKRLEREVITYKTHIERQNRLLELQEKRISELLKEGF